MRIKFRKGKQREFIKKVIENTRCLSLRGLIQFGFDLSYSTLKSYYNENRTLPEDLFNDLCKISRISKESLKISYLDENWGQRIGGGK